MSLAEHLSERIRQIGPEPPLFCPEHIITGRDFTREEVFASVRCEACRRCYELNATWDRQRRNLGVILFDFLVGGELRLAMPAKRRRPTRPTLQRKES